MKVLDHVPPTMETLVKNIFELIDMPEYGYASTSFHQGIDPRTRRATMGVECWDEHGAYDFDVLFEGDATKPCWMHTLTARLDIRHLYHEVRIEWKTTIEDVLEPQGLRKYWPGCEPALYGFIAQTYLWLLDQPMAAQYLQEFVAIVTE